MKSVNENGDENGERWDTLYSLSVLVAVLVNRNRVKTERENGEEAVDTAKPIE